MLSAGTLEQLEPVHMLVILQKEDGALTGK
jgi:hypothetical protein